MASLTIDKLDEASVSLLRSRAEAHGHSVEEEATSILRDALLPMVLVPPPKNRGQHLIDVMRSEFGPLGQVELDIPPRQSMREPPKFDEE